LNGNVLGNYVRFPYTPTTPLRPAPAVKYPDIYQRRSKPAMYDLNPGNKSTWVRANGRVSTLDSSSDNEATRTCIAGKNNPIGQLARLARKAYPPLLCSGKRVGGTTGYTPVRGLLTQRKLPIFIIDQLYKRDRVGCTTGLGQGHITSSLPILYWHDQPGNGNCRNR